MDGWKGDVRCIPVTTATVNMDMTMTMTCDDEGEDDRLGLNDEDVNMWTINLQRGAPVVGIVK